MIELKNITKKYDIDKEEIFVLKDYCLQIRDNQFLGILGDSGSGKSTLLNIIAGLMKPTSGDVIIDGENLYKKTDKEISKFRNKKIGFVFQSFNLLPYMNALENVMLPLYYCGVKRSIREELSKEALDKVGLSNRIYHKPGEMSGGQMQRVAIARAIVNNPDIIIADEPTGNLDSKNSKIIMSLLQEINKTGVTIITVTHNAEYINYFSSHIILN